MPDRMSLPDLLDRMNAKQKKTFAAIQKRFANMNPKIKLEDHIAESKLDLFRKNTLMGVTFYLKNRKDFEDALHAAKKETGRRAFFSMQMDKDHWAIGASFGATEGTGYREMAEMQLTTRSSLLAQARPPGLDTPRFDGQFAPNFADSVNVQDVSSLHCAVWDTGVKRMKGKLSMRPSKESMCSVHIDSAGFTMYDQHGNVVVTPDVGQHTVNELFLQDIVLSRVLKLPDPVVERINLEIPNSSNGYQPRVGVRADLIKTDRLRLSVSASCGFLSRCRDWTGFVSLSGTHRIWDSK